ncbi:MAG: uroporphyrinogen III synthase [Methylotenera sp.]|nr:MAG: uroporphyrinogen III synthase [Methylotenera sp.]
MPNSLQQFGIAITRPAAQAQKLSALIALEGGTPISFPLIDIVPLEDYRAFNNTIETIAEYDWAIFISSNAVQNGMPRLLQAHLALPSQIRFAAIGPVTAEEIRNFGVNTVLTPVGRFDSESLLALPEMQQVAGKRIMIFRGVGGREVLADTLKARGAQVAFAECYRRVNRQQDCLLLKTLWQNKQCHVIVVTSSEAMRTLLELTERGREFWLQNIAICVNHARIAEEALQLADPEAAKQLQIAIADAPGDAAMLACIKNVLSETGKK